MLANSVEESIHEILGGGGGGGQPLLEVGGAGIRESLLETLKEGRGGGGGGGGPLIASIERGEVDGWDIDKRFPLEVTGGGGGGGGGGG